MATALRSVQPLDSWLSSDKSLSAFLLWGISLPKISVKGLGNKLEAEFLGLLFFSFVGLAFFVLFLFSPEILSCTRGNSSKENVTETFTVFTAVSLDYFPCQNPVNCLFFFSFQMMHILLFFPPSVKLDKSVKKRYYWRQVIKFTVGYLESSLACSYLTKNKFCMYACLPALELE